MKWNTQTDDRWARKIMTFHPDQSEPDYLWRWGCIVSCITNIIQYLTDTEFTPDEANKLFKKKAMYLYLDNPNTPSSRASVIVWSKIKDHYKNLFSIRIRLDTNMFTYREDTFYIARVKHPVTGGSHYVNILSRSRKNFWCFDVEDGTIKSYNPKDVNYIHEFRKV